MVETDWLTRDEVARILKFSTKTLANWASATPPQGPRFTKVGGKCRYRISDVNAWKEAYFAEIDSEAA